MRIGIVGETFNGALFNFESLLWSSGLVEQGAQNLPAQRVVRIVLNEQPSRDLLRERISSRLVQTEQVVLPLCGWLQGRGSELIHHLCGPIVLCSLFQQSLGAREIADFLVSRQEPEPVIQHLGLHLAGDLKMPNGLRCLTASHEQTTHSAVGLRMFRQNLEDSAQQFDGLLILTDLYVRVGLTQGAS